MFVECVGVPAADMKELVQNLATTGKSINDWKKMVADKKRFWKVKRCVMHPDIPEDMVHLERSMLQVTI